MAKSKFTLKLTPNAYKQRNRNNMLAIANAALRRMDKYVPYDNGPLKNTAESKVSNNGKGEIKYIQPYSAKQYYKNKGNGRRGAYWDKKMMSAEGSQFMKEAEGLLKR